MPRPSPGPSTRAHACRGTSQKTPMTLGSGDPLPQARRPRDSEETLADCSLMNINNFRAEKLPQGNISGEEAGDGAGEETSVTDQTQKISLQEVQASNQ